MQILKMLSNNIKDLVKITASSILSLTITNKQVTVISNNCWGGFMYQYYGLRYNTPFVGLFLFAPDYIRMLKDLESYLAMDLSFIDSKDSKYASSMIDCNTPDTYPIGLLGDVEIHFWHYKSNEEAKSKWVERLKRVDYCNMLVKFCDRDLCTAELIEEFDSLSFRNKVCFTSKPYPNYKSVVYLQECDGLNEVENEWIHSRRVYSFHKVVNKILQQP